jgi:hypothetical protein
MDEQSRSETRVGYNYVLIIIKTENVENRPSLLRKSKTFAPAIVGSHDAKTRNDHNTSNALCTAVHYDL